MIKDVYDENRFYFFLNVKIIFVRHLTEVDEDEPLNLSTKSNRSNSNAIIWSPASICEKESAEGLPIKVELDHIKSESLNANNQIVANSSSSSSSTSSVSSMRTHPMPIQEFLEKAHASGISADFLQKLQRRTNDSNDNFPSHLTQAAAAAAAAAAAVQAATNTTELLTHLQKREFDIIAKNHIDVYAESLLKSSENLRNNNEKLRNANIQNYNNNNNNNNDTTLNDANKLNNGHKSVSVKSDAPKNSRGTEGNRLQKLFQVS